MIAAYPGSFNPPTVAHLAIADAARRRFDLDRLDLVASRTALGKEDVEVPRLADRLAVLESVVATRPWLGLKVVDAQLLVDIARGYDLVVMGADKWAQVNDPAWYGGSAAARDEAVRSLPAVAVFTRPPHDRVAPVATVEMVEVIELAVDHADVSSSAARAGRVEWMCDEARAFDARSGAWSDRARYERWLRGAAVEGTTR